MICIKTKSLVMFSINAHKRVSKVVVSILQYIFLEQYAKPSMFTYDQITPDAITERKLSLPPNKCLKRLAYGLETFISAVDSSLRNKKTTAPKA